MIQIKNLAILFFLLGVVAVVPIQAAENDVGSSFSTGPSSDSTTSESAESGDDPPADAPASEDDPKATTDEEADDSQAPALSLDTSSFSNPTLGN